MKKKYIVLVVVAAGVLVGSELLVLQTTPPPDPPDPEVINCVFPESTNDMAWPYADKNQLTVEEAAIPQMKSDH